MFQKKSYFENQNNELRFSIVERRAPYARKKNPLDIKNSLGYPPPRKSGRGRGSGVIIFLLKLFFFNIPDLVHRRTAAPVAAENRR